MRARLEEAEERRKAQSEAKLKVVRETTGLERHNRMRSASATRREAHYSATLEKRQQQLQESGQQKQILILNTVTKIKPFEKQIELGGGIHATSPYPFLAHLYLQEMRDKLREKHKKHDMIRLKQQLNSERAGVVESGGSALNASGDFRENKDHFFDD